MTVPNTRPTMRRIADSLCALIVLLFAIADAPAQATKTCFPTCSETDARFLSLVGTNLHSLAGDRMTFSFRVPASETAFNLEIFDGETGGVWDRAGSPVEFTVVADPDYDGVAEPGEYVFGPFLGSSMTDNAWSLISIPTSNDARLSAAGDYFYTLTARLVDASLPNTWSNFKLRANANILLQTQAFAFSAPMFTLAEARIIYPNLDPNNLMSPASLAGSTYDGTWTFHMQVEKGAVFGTRPDTAYVDIWDGDMDFGSFDGSEVDDDDPNTPNAPVLPAWATGTSAVSESAVAVASPFDDNASPLYRRSPSIRYAITAPDSAVYVNNNPSGSQEWERFSASLLGGVPAIHDHAASAIPDGIYAVRISGMDISNMNAWRSTFRFVGVCDTGGACAPPPPCATCSTCSTATATKGYWKNHEDRWPVGSLFIGGEWRDKSTLLEWLSSRSTDKFIIVASQLVAAMLNVRNGADNSCIAETIDEGSRWIQSAVSSRPIRNSSELWSSTVAALARRLDAYNNGLLCAPHRDAVGCDEGSEGIAPSGSGGGID